MKHNQEKGRIDNQFRTKLFGILRRERAVLKELEGQIEEARKQKGELEVKKAQLEQEKAVFQTPPAQTRL